MTISKDFCVPEPVRIFIHYPKMQIYFAECLFIIQIPIIFSHVLQFIFANICHTVRGVPVFGHVDASL